MRNLRVPDERLAWEYDYVQRHLSPAVLEINLCAHAQPWCSPDERLLYCVGIIMIMCGNTCQLHLSYVGMRNLRVRLTKDCCIAWE